MGEHYHSTNGAITEARHVFIQAGLRHFVTKNPTRPISILEIGFGTGLNALLTCLMAHEMERIIQYTGVEAFPLEISEIEKLNYPKFLKIPAPCFLNLHSGPWEIPFQMNPYFILTKQKQFFTEIDQPNSFDIIYFDAFGPSVQPESWSETIFKNMYAALKLNGILVTYSAKGEVRRTWERLGLRVERLPGPPGKREMLRGTK